MRISSISNRTRNREREREREREKEREREREREGGREITKFGFIRTRDKDLKDGAIYRTYDRDIVDKTLRFDPSIFNC